MARPGTFTKGNPYAFKPGQSGNPTGQHKNPPDVVEMARAATPQAIAALIKKLDDPDHCIQAAIALLDRGWGRPPQAVYAQIGGTGEPVKVAYEFYWADAATNTIPKSEASTIDAASANGDAEDDGESGPVIVWQDGTRAK